MTIRFRRFTFMNVEQIEEREREKSPIAGMQRMLMQNELAK